MPSHSTPIRGLAALIAAALVACSTSDMRGDGSPANTPPVAESRVAAAAEARRDESERTRREASAKEARTSPLSQAHQAPAATPAITGGIAIAPPAPAMERDASYTGITTRAAPAHPVRRVAQAPVSTFSIDVDTGSYSSVRGLVRRGASVPAAAVRAEEMLNYFSYDDPRPEALGSKLPFAVRTELAPSPWKAGNHLLRIGIQAADPAQDTLPPANLVLLIDVSGSMNIPQSLPLVKEAMLAFVEQLREQDRVAIVTYAGSTRVALPSTPGHEKTRIREAIEALQAGGSTAGASGLRLAYQQARQGYIQGGINRILLATDGDFNVGVTNIDQLKEIVAAERRSGIGLSTLGVGHASYNDALMEAVADVGDGKYSFLDTVAEARKVLVHEFRSTLATVAADVKLQLEFNPAVVKEYRLIGYDNRALREEDFANDRVDAGDIGAGHHVTALYEVTLQGQAGLLPQRRYPANRIEAAAAGRTNELAWLRIRYKAPGSDTSALIEQPVDAKPEAFEQASTDLRFAAAVAGYAQVLAGSAYTGRWTLDDSARLAAASLGRDPHGQRAEFVALVRETSALLARRGGNDTPPIAEFAAPPSR
ncbi:vWA domain-containing protein [Methylibium rhizosphaerae]|uniref:vWA domain-containing protein n=1 Tax=Methylibium rhizosphaerae TaxID=2570323 RepID=UPI001FE25E83|nr:von Willebrand factor type A domain-containing protein [Methylibium rhizosphaerae]